MSLSRRYESLCWTSGCVTSITGIACATVSRDAHDRRPRRDHLALGGRVLPPAEHARERADGRQHAARCVLFSVDIGEIDPLHARRALGRRGRAARRGRAGGRGGGRRRLRARVQHAPHRLGDDRRRTSRSRRSTSRTPPADALARTVERVALLGTPCTMELPFFRERTRGARLRGRRARRAAPRAARSHGLRRAHARRRSRDETRRVLRRADRAARRRRGRARVHRDRRCCSSRTTSTCRSSTPRARTRARASTTR